MESSIREMQSIRTNIIDKNDAARQFVESDFLALQSHMANCAVQCGPTDRVKALVAAALQFAGTRLVSTACVSCLLVAAVFSYA